MCDRPASFAEDLFRNGMDLNLYALSQNCWDTFAADPVDRGGHARKWVPL